MRQEGIENLVHQINSTKHFKPSWKDV